jgi:hypothetical protein
MLERLVTRRPRRASCHSANVPIRRTFARAFQPKNGERAPSKGIAEKENHTKSVGLQIFCFYHNAILHVGVRPKTRPG